MNTPTQNTAIISIAEYDELRKIKNSLDVRRDEIESLMDKILIHESSIGHMISRSTKFVGKDEALKLLSDEIS